MRWLFAVYFIANLLALFAVLTDVRQQSCTANHCGEITKAIKTLETKGDNLIALVKDALPPKPSSTFSMIFIFIFQVFSTRSDLKIAVFFFSQSISSPLARNSTT